jgi:hypothetical protein
MALFLADDGAEGLEAGEGQVFPKGRFPFAGVGVEVLRDGQQPGLRRALAQGIDQPFLLSLLRMLQADG